MGDPVTAMFVGSSIVKGGSQILGGLADRKSQNEQARMAEEQAAHERARSAVEADEYRRRASLAAARSRAIRGASGVDPNSGTPLAIDVEFAKEGEFGAQQLIHDGATRSYRLEQEASTRKRAGQNAFIGGLIGAGSTFLTAAMGPNGKGWGGSSSTGVDQLAFGGKGPGQYAVGVYR